MEEIVDDEGLDVQALQAQIDLSMAFTQDLVASWLKPTTNKLPKLSRTNEERELQNLLRRPQRLGVGAPLPESTGVFGSEGSKLRNKLTGKKRGREEETTVAAVQSDGEEESRGGAIRKKVKIDPFSGGKRKKTKEQLLSPVLPPTTPTAPPTETQSPFKAEDADTPLLDTLPITNQNSPDSLPPSTPRKKKKHKKHPEALTVTPDALRSRKFPTSAVTDSSTPSRTLMVEHAVTADIVPVTMVPETPNSLNAASIDIPASPRPPTIPESMSTIQPHKLPPKTSNFITMPLLNLMDLPVEETASGEGQSPKKRRRKRKKKKSTLVMQPLQEGDSTVLKD